jgi:hypothetical protein
MERAYRLESGLLPLWPACARASEQNAQLWSQDHLVLIGLRSGNGRKSDDRTGGRSAATEAQTLRILLGGRISGTEFTPRPWLADDDGFRWYKLRISEDVVMVVKSSPVSEGEDEFLKRVIIRRVGIPFEILFELPPSQLVPEYPKYAMTIPPIPAVNSISFSFQTTTYHSTSLH